MGMSQGRGRAARGRAGRSRGFRAATALVLASVVALTMTACLGPGLDFDSGPATAKHEPAPASAADPAPVPRPGDCWEINELEGHVNGLWWVGGTVDCDQPHLMTTTAVLDIETVAPGFEYPPDPYADEYPDSFYDQDGFWDIQYACTDAAGDHVGVEHGTRVVPRWFVPSPEQWDAGQRWLRCDLAVLGLGPFSWANVEPVVGPADALLKRAPRDYPLCVDTPYTPGVQGPWAFMEGVELAACDGQSQWEFGTSLRFTDDEYPGLDVLTERVNDACEPVLAARPHRSSMVVIAPLATYWGSGDRDGICWLL